MWNKCGGGDLKLFRFVKIQYERLRKELSSGGQNTKNHENSQISLFKVIKVGDVI